MGLFGSSSASLPAPKISADGTPIAPNRTERQKCWEGRDGYFKCLDRNDIIDSIKEEKLADEKCKPEAKEFDRVCATSWVKYFKQRRVMEYQRAQTLEKLRKEGAQEMPAGSMPPAGPK